MTSTTKMPSSLDSGQVLQGSFSDLGGLVHLDWVIAGIGRKITYAIATTTIANDTISSTYSEGSTTLAVVHNVYTDGNRTLLSYTTRIS
jgi:hypothetical protein